MELWRNAWREGFAKVLPTEGMMCLAMALKTDQPSLTQGSTTTPPPLVSNQLAFVEGCCAIGFCGWQGESIRLVGDLEEFFAKCCFEADQLLGGPAECRWFLNWFDDTPRAEMRRELLAEVHREIDLRHGIVQLEKAA